jgi:hypothetical protein
MNEIEKEIEEMAKDLIRGAGLKVTERAEFLIKELGYRNCKDKVVLSKEEYEKIKQYEKKVRSGVCFTQKEWFDYINEDSNHTTSLLAQARKETTRDILKNITRVMHDNRQYGSNFVVIYDSDIQELAKEHGVGVEV